MLKLAMALAPLTDDGLAAVAQVGVKHLVQYDMSNRSEKFDGIEGLIARASRFGLDVPIVESGPPIDRIVLGLDGASAQIEEWIVLLKRLGTLGVKVVCYNFMPQVLADAMVVRTDVAASTRGGSITTAFRKDDLPSPAISIVPPATAEAMTDNLGAFLKRVLPVAEDAGIRLAMHPDDPPMSPISGYARIMSSTERLEWLLGLNSSPANALTLCAGCFGEMNEDPSSFLRRFPSRIAFVHLRNIRGTPNDFVETWPDDGDIDLPRLLATLLELNVDAYLRPDHAPRLSTEAQDTAGYGFQGHLFTLGYIRGVLDAYLQKSSMTNVLAA